MKEGKLTFAGGAGSVTGSNFLFEIGGKRMLIDCGFFQGSHKMGDEANREAFPYDPSAIDILFVTHAHIDHIGRIPRLVREGFHGLIVSTPPTKDLAEIMLNDTVDILRREAEHEKKNPIYTAADVHEAMKHWKTHDYRHPFDVGEGMTAEFRDAGHMLGSAMVLIQVGQTKIAFSGDLGNSPAPLLDDTDIIADATYLVMESVYGDRVHEHRDERKDILKKTIIESVHHGGVLLIPAFSLERTQELLSEINDFAEHGEIPRIPVYLDSPLAIRATRVYRDHPNYLNKETRSLIASGDDPFLFPGLHMTEKREESIAIWERQGPKVIIAGSGMLNGGRIIHHIRHYAPRAHTTILFAGYQAVGTPGRLLQDGTKGLTFNGEKINIKAKILTLPGYSGHRDSEGLLQFAETALPACKKIFVVLGEPKASMFFAQRLQDYLGADAVVPEAGSSVSLKFS